MLVFWNHLISNAICWILLPTTMTFPISIFITTNVTLSVSSGKGQANQIKLKRRLNAEG